MIATPWGYSVDADELPPLITVSDFKAATGNAYCSDDGRIAKAIDMASAAIRGFCGWHVSPRLRCECETEGEGNIVLLPAVGVTEVESLEIFGIPCSNYRFKPSGVVKLMAGVFPFEWGSVRATYTAGYDACAVTSAVCKLVSTAITAQAGVREEHAGGVGMTYTTNADGTTGGVYLSQSDRDALQAFRLSKAW